MLCRARVQLPVAVSVLAALMPAALAQTQPASGPAVTAPTPAADPAAAKFGEGWRKNFNNKILARALVAWEKSIGMLKRAEAEMPTIAEKARAARTELETVLGPEARAMAQALELSDPSAAAEWKAYQAKDLAKLIADEVITPEAVQAAIAPGGALTVHGFSPEPLGVMLSFRAAYAQRPEQELTDGFAVPTSFAAGSGAGSLGIRLTLPVSWAGASISKDGSRTFAAHMAAGPALVTIGSHAREGSGPPTDKELVDATARVLGAVGPDDRVTTPSQGDCFGRQGTVQTIRSMKQGPRGRMQLLARCCVFVEYDRLVTLVATIVETTSTDQPALDDTGMERLEAIYRPLMRSIVASLSTSTSPATAAPRSP